MDPIQKNAVGYIRISSTRQKDNESPDTQKNTIQNYADNNNITIVKWFYDIAKSGRNADRDGLQELLTYCAKNKSKIDHWIVYNMKRASRDIDTYSNEVRLVLKAIGVSIKSATEPAVDDTKEGRFMENLLVLLGQLDNEGKAEVTIDNMRSLALQGYWQHPPKLGYSPCKLSNESGKPRPSMTPNAVAPLVVKVLERFSQGDISKAELTRYAQKVGLKSIYGNTLSKDQIHKLLSAPEYAGYVHDKFTDYELVEGKHEALISRSTYELNKRFLYGFRTRKGQNHRKISPEYPLKDFLK